MKGDFSRSTFDPKKHYTSVRMQQGRMQLDADWNEQMDILLYLLRAQAQDLLGPYGAPAASAGFEIKPTNEGQADLTIKKGRYYVDGILVENESDTLFSAQPYRPNARLPEAAHNGDRYMVYLDVWERNLNGHRGPIDPGACPERPRHDDPHPDRLAGEAVAGALRAGRRPTCQPMMISSRRGMTGEIRRPCRSEFWRPRQLQPKVNTTEYGLTNQLYRVEIHSAGDETTFKWSRDNGSVAFAVSESGTGQNEPASDSDAGGFTGRDAVEGGRLGGVGGCVL